MIYYLFNFSSMQAILLFSIQSQIINLNNDVQDTHTQKKEKVGKIIIIF